MQSLNRSQEVNVHNLHLVCPIKSNRLAAWQIRKIYIDANSDWEQGEEYGPLERQPDALWLNILQWLNILHSWSLICSVIRETNTFIPPPAVLQYLNNYYSCFCFRQNDPYSSTKAYCTILFIVKTMRSGLQKWRSLGDHFTVPSLVLHKQTVVEVLVHCLEAVRTWIGRNRPRWNSSKAGWFGSVG